MKSSLTLIFCLLSVLLISCRPGLRPALYIIDAESRRQLNTEDSYYLENRELIDRPEGLPHRAGQGNILISNQTIINPEQAEIETGLIRAVGEIKYRIYVALPEEISGDSLDIASKSICRIVALYHLAERLRHYTCTEGFLKIDSVKSSSFHALFSGKYFNPENDSLVFEGDLKVKRKKR
ncbi:MAG: hypothetical protein JSU69_09690 [Candidatus Zixiibacteriota bacterium]|nr:MAG: hypothetical protein JSU69_09690 [candidate division Zixibacteria bacterium]